MSQTHDTATEAQPAAQAAMSDLVSDVAREAFAHALNGGNIFALDRLPKRSELIALLAAQPSTGAQGEAAKPLEGWTITFEQNRNWLVESPSGDSVYVFSDDESPLGEVCRQLLQSLAFGVYTAPSAAPSPVAQTSGDVSELAFIAKEARHELSHIENYLQETFAPIEVRNRTIDLRSAVIDLERKAVAALSPTLQKVGDVQFDESDFDYKSLLWQNIDLWFHAAAGECSRGRADQVVSHIKYLISKYVKQAASQPSNAVPSGWKLVPTEPTKKMGKAGAHNGAPGTFAADRIYEAMLNAAPTAPAVSNAVQDAPKPFAYMSKEDYDLAVSIGGPATFIIGRKTDPTDIAIFAAPAAIDAQDAYALGWINCAKWAYRADLIADIDSPSYLLDRDAALQSPPQGQAEGERS